MKIGDSISIKGPKGHFQYRPNMVPRIGIIAGGTGLTPCLQVLSAALNNPKDRTRFDLIYANVSEDEILLKERLDKLAADHPKQMTVRYFINEASNGWEGDVGFVTKQAIADTLVRAEEEGRLLMCGPPPMVSAMKKHLTELGFEVPKAISKAEDVSMPRRRTLTCSNSSSSELCRVASCATVLVVRSRAHP